MLAASGVKRMKRNENSVACRRPCLMARRLSPDARLAEEQPRARYGERSGQKDVRDEPGDRRLQIGRVIAIKERQFSGKALVGRDHGFVDEREAPELADQRGEFLLVQGGVAIERSLDFLQLR